jgi:hypothetical protein
VQIFEPTSENDPASVQPAYMLNLPLPNEISFCFTMANRRRTPGKYMQIVLIRDKHQLHVNLLLGNRI